MNELKAEMNFSAPALGQCCVICSFKITTQLFVESGLVGISQRKQQNSPVQWKQRSALGCEKKKKKENCVPLVVV
jgi:hypothetical protein